MARFKSISVCLPGQNELEELTFFPNREKTTKTALVYGRNGTGKSTISRSFWELATSTNDETDAELAPYATFFGKQSETSYRFVEEGRDRSPRIGGKRLRVFGDDFVKQNFETVKAGLKTVVLFGDQVDLNKELQKVRGELTGIRNQEKNIEIKLIRAQGNKQNALNGVNAILGQGWRQRQQGIDGSNRYVTEKVRDRIIKTSASATEDLDDLKQKFLKQLEAFDRTRENSNPVTGSVNIVGHSIIPDRLDLIESILAEVPAGGGNDHVIVKRIKESISAGFEAELRRSISWFEDRSRDHCFACQQSLESDHRDELISNLKAILEDSVNDAEAKIKSSYLDEIEVNFPDRVNLFLSDDRKKELMETCQSVNVSIVKVNSLLEQKLEKIYSALPLNGLKEKLLTDLDVLKKLVDKAESARGDWNNRLKKIDQMRADLTASNEQIARREIDAALLRWREAEKQLAEVQKELRDMRQKAEELECHENQIIAELENHEIAVTEINRFLTGVFFSEDRMKLVAVDHASDSEVDAEHKYTVQVRGRDVRPSNLSAGERNVLALAYFFVRACSGGVKGSHRADEYLLIIDDPISSLDYENRIGLMSHLAHEISKFLEENKNSQAIVFTHDLSVLRGLSSLLGAGENLDEGEQSGSPVAKLHLKRLSDDGSERLQLEHLSGVDDEYFTLMRNLFDFATEDGDSPRLDDWVRERGIGNQARRFLEAYSQFVHGCSYHALLEKSAVKSALLSGQIDRLNGVVNRLLLNEESHGADKAKNLEFTNMSNSVSPAEIQRVVRGILGLVALVSPRHIEDRKGEQALDQAKSWL